MTYFKAIVLAGAVAVAGAFSASSADALGFSLSGVFNITAYNYTVKGGTDAVRKGNSFATVANFDSIASGATSVGTVNTNGFASFSYSGALDFKTSKKANQTTTTGDFLNSANGILSSLSPNFTQFAMLTNSAGTGQGDAGANKAFSIATLYRITAVSLTGVDDLSLLQFVKHDDGVTVLGKTKSVVNAKPSVEVTTNLKNELDGNAGNFVLYYASANGDPSVLRVTAIPLPAAAWLLLGVAGALVVAKRRSSVRVA